MPACIVCKADYTPGQPCPRCRSDNSAWEEWKREEEALGPGGALLRFLEPHFGLPLMIAGWALAFGLLGMLWPWGGVKPYVLILAIALTFAGCVLTVPLVHEERFALREQELLRTVRRGWKRGLGVEIRAILVPTVALGLAMLLTLALAQSEMVWELMEWLVLEEVTAPGAGAPPPQEEPGLKERVERVFPLMCLSGYATLAAFAYSSSLMLGQAYAARLNARLPQPIFLREELLVEVVRREASRTVCRSNTPTLIGGKETSDGTEPGARNWTWDEMERTDDGGIRLKAIVRAGSKAEESLIGEWTEGPVDITYEIEADAWSRVKKVVRVEKEKK